MIKKPSLRSNSTLTALFVSAGAIICVSTAAAGGCVGEQPNTITQTTSATTSGTSTSGGDMDAGPSPSGKAEELFAALEPELKTNCGVCHDAGGLADTPFLAGPNRYKSLISWPGVVVKDPAKSLFLTYSVKGGKHSGTNLDAAIVDPTLKARVTEWLQEEAKAIAVPPPDVGPAIEPFTPILGFNAVYLGPLGPDFEGMAITFSANELSAKTLELTQIQVHTTSKLGVHLVHPLFVVFPDGGDADPDPVDSFSNVDQSYEQGSGGQLGPGTAVLTNWGPKAKLSIAFEVIEMLSGPDPDAGMDGGTGGCKDLAGFKANAEPLFTQRCSNCHGGGNGGATGAVDMTKLNNDSQAACEQIRFRVNPADPNASQIFITTNPGGNAAHPFKFGGNATNFNAFRDAVSKWIAAEK